MPFPCRDFLEPSGGEYPCDNIRKAGKVGEIDSKKQDTAVEPQRCVHKWLDSAAKILRSYQTERQRLKKSQASPKF
jgi:hypothetical protein